jgi:hypothetical protein
VPRARAAAIVLALAATNVSAQEPPAPEEIGPPPLPPVEIHGFVSQGFILTTDNNYLAESEDGSFEFAEVGLNFTKALTERLRAGVQLFARDLGPSGDYDAKLDWFYLDYRWTDRLGVRAGRVKLPFGLYNDTSDIDAARVPVLLPQSIYPTQNRNFLLAQTGVEIYGQLAAGGAGAIAYNLYGGTVFIEIEEGGQTPYEIRGLRTPYIFGGRLLWEAPIEGLRAGGSVQALRLEADLRYPAVMRDVKLEVPAVLWVASVEYLREEWLFAAEYSRWHTEIESDDPALFPETETVSERAYVMASRRLGRLTPGAYYSLFYPDVDDREGRAQQQHDVAATLRVDLNAWWLLKLEAHFMHGTAAATPALNDRPRGELANNWGLFLVKTTAYF